MHIRRAVTADQAFIAQMAQLACALEGRHPIPAAGSSEVVQIMPGPTDVTFIATDEQRRPVGAAWCYRSDPPLQRDRDGRASPELAMAVHRGARNRGIGAALIEALAESLEGQASALTLNVHLLNPAVRLYVRTGFRVVGHGRGWYGVAMSRPLGASQVE